MPREKVYKYRAEIDHQAMRQQLDQMRSAVGVSMQMQSPSYTQNMMGMANAGALGYNTLTSDLRSMAGTLSQISPSSMMAPSTINMGFTQSLMGMAGIGAPPTMYSGDYEKLARNDMANRLARTGTSAITSAIDFGANWGPNIAMGAAAAAGGQGAVGSLVAGGVGLFKYGMMAGFGGMAAAGTVSYGVGKIRDQVATQGRFENMLYSASRGKMDYVKRSGIARSMRGSIASTSGIDNQGGAELLAYGTEAGILDATRGAEEFGEKYKSLIKATETIMKTFHQSIKDSVRTMAKMREAGIFDVEDFASNSQLVDARSSLAGITNTAMLQLQAGAAKAGAREGGIGAIQAGGSASLISASIGQMFKSGNLTDEMIFSATRMSGQAGKVAMAQSATGGIMQFMAAGGRGKQLMAGLSDLEGGIDPEKWRDLVSGGKGAIDRILQSGARAQDIRLRETKDGGVTFAGEMGDLQEKITPEMYHELISGRMKTYGQLKFGTADLNKYQRSNILKNDLLMSDEAARMYWSAAYDDPSLLKNVQRSSDRSMSEAAVKSAMHGRSRLTKVGTWVDQMGVTVSSPLVDAKDAMYNAFTNIIGDSPDAKYAGGNLLEAGEFSLRGDAGSGINIDPVRGLSKRIGLMKKIMARQGGVSPWLNEKLAALTGASEHQDKPFAAMILSKGELIGSLLTPLNKQKLKGGKYRGEMIDKLTEGLGNRGVAEILVDSIRDGSADDISSIRSTINKSKLTESFSNIGATAGELYRQLSKSGFKGVSSEMKGAMRRAITDDFSGSEMIQMGETMSGLDESKLDKGTAALARHLKNTITDLLRGTDPTRRSQASKELAAAESIESIPGLIRAQTEAIKSLRG